MIHVFVSLFSPCNNANNGRNPLFCSFPALMTFFSVIAFIDEKIIGAINKAAIVAIIGPLSKSTFWLFILCITVLIAPSINRSQFSSEVTLQF